MIDILHLLETNQPLVLFINLALCLAIMVICLCRLNAMSHDVLLRVQVEYVFYMGAGFISVARPWWGENVGWASLMLETAILISFLSSTHAWRRVRTVSAPVDVPPDSARSEVTA